MPHLTPGAVLTEHWLKPRQTSPKKLADAIGVSPSRISDIIHGRRPITKDTALRFSQFFSNAPRYWLLLQAYQDAWEVDQENGLLAERTTA